MLSAFEGLTTDEFSKVVPKVTNDSSSMTIEVDINQNSDDATLNNQADLVIGNIYALKENLKVWCKANKVPFQGEKLINKNKGDVALIHDLHNVRKHGRLKRKPRSGVTPKLKILGNAVSLEGDHNMTFNVQTGEHSFTDGSGGDPKLTLVALILDENGDVVGNFLEICASAIDKWKVELLSAGVPIQK